MARWVRTAILTAAPTVASVAGSAQPGFPPKLLPLIMVASHPATNPAKLQNFPN